MTCPNCGAETRPGQRFCAECGTRLERACTNCGAALPAAARFCSECGTAAEADAQGVTAPPGAVDQPGTEPPSAERPGMESPVAERRLVTVLFVDLVGSTSSAEGQDPEETREFLERYFELCRERIDRYGGTIEKFIGDAVMAVWGAPVAREDDAERAVRAALELVEDIGRELAMAGRPASARAGALTGEAAVTLGAHAQAMVAGDLVNTASRLQSIAPAGAVYVGERTMLAAGPSIVFEEVGEQALKGRAEAISAWRAIRVVAGIGGSKRAEGLEAPFVGRDSELSLLKDLFHATGRERRVRLVSISGQAGIGKSRLAWELEKYLDGVVETVYWHHGRSPAYGSGVTFWALGEMVRGRAGIQEGEDAASSRTKLRATLNEYVPDDEERSWIEPRLLGLLGLDDAPAEEPGETFSAWRTFFERVADRGTSMLVFEDLQWADAGLLDFIEHFVEWSRGRPILIVTLARPELVDRRPTWGAGYRSFTSIYLEPLPPDEMRRLLAGLAPGLPDPAVSAILARAEGIPLYAVETVRMLVGAGNLVREGDRYVVHGDLQKLSIPETLHALIAARLDSLDPADRSLVQDAAVLGQSFTLGALAAVRAEEVAALEPRLRGLVARELIRVDANPRSPERGQYQFVQSVIREVAYSTLSRRDRRAKHLAAARGFEALGDDELAAVLASHYVSAYRASAAGPEADAVAAQARVALRAAADRAAALHSHEQAMEMLEQALEVTTDPGERATLEERAAESALFAGRYDVAERMLQGAIERRRALGDLAGLARAAEAMSNVYINKGAIDESVALLRPILEQIDRTPGVGAESTARVCSELARAYMLQQDFDASAELADRALALAEPIDLLPVIVETLNTKGVAITPSRPREGIALLYGAVDLARMHELPRAEMRAINNLATLLDVEAPARQADLTRQALDVVTRLGYRDASVYFRAFEADGESLVGNWDAAEQILRDLEEDVVLRHQTLSEMVFHWVGARLAAGRGNEDVVARHRARLDELGALISQQEFLAGTGNTVATAFLFLGRLEDAARQAEATMKMQASRAQDDVLLGRIAFRRRDLAGLRAGLEHLQARPTRGRAVDVYKAELSASILLLEQPGAAAIAAFADVQQRYRALGMLLDLALVQLGLALELGPGDPTGRQVGEEAAAAFKRMGATRLLAQLDPVLGAAVERAGARPSETRAAEAAVSSTPS